ncbi:MAG TPA: hypothetical protein PLW37_08910 [bacterium]|nr:hypothetical protein [bacterium]HNW15938.1 hypothetical protein [bacterium]HNZ54338.1 hypothetical protein [bacterium]HOG44125.1 hypothetical protein [bacterium]HPG35992.1 hypothetical protein [bacterium]
MKIVNISSVFLISCLCFVFFCSCNSKMAAVKNADQMECKKVDLEESWLFDWNKTRECSVKMKRRGLDKATAQKMDFIEGEWYYLKNDPDGAVYKFASAVKGPDCLVSKASVYYLKRMGHRLNEGDLLSIEECKQDPGSDFQRYLALLGQKSEDPRSVDLDKFHELYSNVLGSDTPPLLYNIALSAIECSNFKQGYELLRNISLRFPEFEKVSAVLKELDIKDE